MFNELVRDKVGLSKSESIISFKEDINVKWTRLGLIILPKPENRNQN